jgi:hypothetical protein
VKRSQRPQYEKRSVVIYSECDYKKSAKEHILISVLFLQSFVLKTDIERENKIYTTIEPL